MAIALLVLMVVLALIAIVALIGLIGNIIGVILTLIVAGLIGWLADTIVPGQMPYGTLGAVLAGLVGSWLGVALLGTIGPVIFHIPVISALVGAIIIAFVFPLITQPVVRRRQ